MKRGDWVRVWGYDKKMALETRYIAHIEGALEPHLCVDSHDLAELEAGESFETTQWLNAEPIEDPKRKGIVNGTRVLVRDYEGADWNRRYATGEWADTGDILCWGGGCDEWASDGKKIWWRQWKLAEEPKWKPKVGDRVTLVVPWHGAVWGGERGKIGGTIDHIWDDGRMLVNWDNGGVGDADAYTTDHLQPL